MMNEMNAARSRAPRKVAVRNLPSPVMVTIKLITFIGKRLHVHNALQGFLDDRGRVGETILRFP